jgi:phosphatidylethanolamine-binding protein (PEBP) family uncharacterized protein
MEKLIEIWLRLCHWIEFDVMEDEASAQETLDDMRKQGIFIQLRERKNKNGKTEYVLYVKDSDRDLARYYTGWRY